MKSKHFQSALCLFLIIIGILEISFLLVRSQSKIKKVAGLSQINLTTPKSTLKDPPKIIDGATDPKIGAKAVLLKDLSSSYVLYEENSETKVPIASTTKITTAIVVLEKYGDRLNEPVTITREMINVEGSDIKLFIGERMTVENLLKGLLIMSGNDTAYSLAIHFGGLDNFVADMNNKAAQIGLLDTQYKDPAGLNDDGYSTARDLSIAAAYAMRFPKFREIVKTSETNIASIDGHIHELKSSNRMIKPEESLYYPLAIGVKTGFTYAAGHCLVSVASKDSHEILGVVLNTNENTITASARESKKLLEWGFANWRW